MLPDADPGLLAPGASETDGVRASSTLATAALAGTAGPWRFQLNARATGRSHSGEGNAIAAPGQRLNVARVPSGSRASFDSALLAAVRKQLEALEERLGSQISALREQCQGDRLREVALSRLEERVKVAEGLQPRLDRRLAELTGNSKGLSDEMQAQIRRVDLMDDRLSSWRHQFEEEIRQRHTDFEHKLQKVTVSIRVADASVQEAQKPLIQRLNRLEVDVAERLVLREDVQDSLAGLWARVGALEGQRLEDQRSLEELRLATGRASALPRPGSADEALAILNRRIADVTERVDRSVQEVHEAHAQLAAQEQQQKALRTLFERKEEHIRALSEQLERGDWDGKLELVRQAAQEEAKQKVEHLERFELLAKRVEFHEQVQEELRSMHQQALRSLKTSAGTEPELSGAVQECQERIQQSEGRLAELEAEFASCRADKDLAPRVAELIAQLRDVAPKVILQEQSLKQILEAGLPERLDQLEGRSLNIGEQLAVLRASLVADYATKQDLHGLMEQATKQGATSDRSAADMAEVRGELQRHRARLAEQVEASQRTAAEHARLKALLEATSETAGGIMSDLGSLKQDLRTLAVAPAGSEDFSQVAGQLRKHEALLSEQAEQGRKAAAEASDAKRDLVRLAAFTGSISEAANTLVSDLAGLRQEVREFAETSCCSEQQMRAEALAQARAELSEGGGNGKTTDGSERQQLLHVVQRMQQDQESEAEAHQKVLAWIDELCKRLAMLDTALVAEAPQCNPTVPPNFVERFELLVERQSEMQRLERQIEAKVDDFANTAMLSQEAAE